MEAQEENQWCHQVLRSRWRALGKAIHGWTKKTTWIRLTGFITFDRLSCGLIWWLWSYDQKEVSSQALPIWWRRRVLYHRAWNWQAAARAQEDWAICRTNTGDCWVFLHVLAKSQKLDQGMWSQLHMSGGWPGCLGGCEPGSAFGRWSPCQGCWQCCCGNYQWGIPQPCSSEKCSGTNIYPEWILPCPSHFVEVLCNVSSTSNRLAIQTPTFHMFCLSGQPGQRGVHEVRWISFAEERQDQITDWWFAKKISRRSDCQEVSQPSFRKWQPT